MEQLETQLMPKPFASIEVRSNYFDAQPPELNIPATYLENMYDRMPGSAERTALEELVASGDEMSIALTEPNPDMGPYYSPLRLSKSAVEFWKDVDEAVAQSPAGVASIRELMSALIESQNASSERTNILHELNKAMVPVYKSLRAKGYSYYDIVS